MCETLESRRCLAGNVMASVTNGELLVKGDAAANNVEIRQIATPSSQGEWPGYSYKIIGRNTTINNVPPSSHVGNTSFSIVTVEGVKSGMCVFLAAGDDILRVTRPNVGRANVPGTVRIVMGNGEDQATLYMANHQKVNIEMGGDADGLSLNSSIVKALTVETDASPSPPAGAEKSYADGADSVYANALTATGAVSINTGGRDDVVNMGFGHLSGAITVETNWGNDTCALGERIEGAFSANCSITAKTGSGKDILAVTVSAGTFVLSSGDGDDEVSVGLDHGNTTPAKSLTVWLSRGNDSLTVRPASGEFARFDGGFGNDTISGEENAEFDSLVIANFES
jgi:hypothetical protein